MPNASAPMSAPVGGMAMPAVAAAPAGATPTPLSETSLDALAAARDSEPVANQEAYEGVVDNSFLPVSASNTLSTFSIDVDTASYSIIRRDLNQGRLPPKEAVRIEEMINYFTYAYPPPSKDVPFSVNLEAVACPWNPEHQLVRIGLQGKTIASDARPVSNLVFLVDVSGSMQDPNKLPLVKAGLKLLVDQLTENDRVAIVVYAGAAGMVLDSTTGDKKREILAALENLQAGGSTNGGEGIQLAYRVAADHLVPKGVNRVILCSDGDFNVGVTDRNSLVSLVEQQAKGGVFLTMLGFGSGNFKDATMEQLADKGNGNYAYIDTLNEAKKVFVDQIQGTLMTIAKDVKIQVDFNPAKVASFRLIGYENRILAHQDFDNDQKDAGEIGAGHTVTALYELVPAVSDVPVGRATGEPAGDKLLTVRLRYKQPDAAESQLLEFSAMDRGLAFSQASPDCAWAAAVAAFGMILRDSPYKGNATLPAVLEIAQTAKGDDKAGYRTEFLELVRSAQRLATGNRSVSAGPRQ